MRAHLLVAALLFAGCVGGEDDAPRFVTREEAILLAAPYPDLVIEVDFLAQAAPSKLALDALLTVAREQTLKSSVTILDPEEIDPALARRAGASWTPEEIVDVHVRTFDSGEPFQLGNGTQAFLHAIFLDANLALTDDDGTRYAAGLSSFNVMWVFHEADLLDARFARVGYPHEALPRVGSDERQAGILVHELGHAMGLVNNGVPMVRPHNDPDDPAHSNNPDSVMSGGWDLVDQSKTKVLHGDSPSLWFDEDDRADLAAFRNGARP